MTCPPQAPAFGDRGVLVDALGWLDRAGQPAQRPTEQTECLPRSRQATSQMLRKAAHVQLIGSPGALVEQRESP